LEPELLAALTSPGAPLPTTPEMRAAYEAIFHEHEEDNVPQGPEHNHAADDLEDVLCEYARHLWVCREVACYWDRSRPSVYLGPDVMACDPPGPAREHRSYRTWEHGRFRLAIEIASESSETRDQTLKPELYAAGLKPEELFYFDPFALELRMWLYNNTAYDEVAPQANGRFWSRVAELWFGIEGDRLRLYDREGQPLGNYAEQRARADQERERALWEARRADREQSRGDQLEAARADEARRRAAAEAAQADEARRRAAAEAAQAEAARQRAVAEAERDELMRRLAALEADLMDRRGK
jgi:Uma2 family endonuclease